MATVCIVNIPMNMGVQIVFLFSSHNYPKVELVDHIIILFLIFWGTYILFFIITVSRLLRGFKEISIIKEKSNFWRQKICLKNSGNWKFYSQKKGCFWGYIVKSSVSKPAYWYPWKCIRHPYITEGCFWEVNFKNVEKSFLQLICVRMSLCS